MDSQSTLCLTREAPQHFHYEMRATTYGEVYPSSGHSLNIYGWRASTQEDTYKAQPGALLGNWVEERADLQFRKRMPPLPSDYAHNFATIYKKSYERPFIPVDEAVRHALEREKFAYPTHQPELDAPVAKQYDAMKTVSMATYTDPYPAK